MTTITRPILSLAWQGSRYTLAVVFSFCVSVFWPLATFVIAIGVIGLLVLVLTLGFTLSFVSGSADGPLQAALAAVGLPLFFVFGAGIAGIAIIAVSGLSVLLLALPLAFVTEVLLSAIQSTLVRLAIYVLESALLGIAAVAIWLWLGPLELDGIQDVVVAVLLFLSVSGNIGGIGFALTFAEQARRLIIRLFERSRNRLAHNTI